VPDETKQQVHAQNGLDNRLVFDLIRAMNIARRNLVAYPRGHALVVESFEKVLNVLQEYFEYSNHLILGIAKDTLMLGTKALDRKIPVFQNFAQILFEHGIVSLTFFRDLTVDELMDFDHIISQKRNDVHRQGGVATLFSKAKVQNIKVQLIDYRMFQAQEGPLDAEADKDNSQESLFWWQFVRGVMEGTLDPLGVPSDGMEDFDPEALAKILNEQYVGGGGSIGGGPGGGGPIEEGLDGGGPGGGWSIGEGLVGLESGGGGSGERGSGKGGSGFGIFLDSRSFDFVQLAYDEVSTARLNKFVRSLDHKLRKTFVERFFSSFSRNTGALNQLIPNLSDDIIIDALEKNTKKELYIPPNILDILKRLKKESASEDFDNADELLGSFSKDELTEKFSVIFREDEVDRFVPLDYQKMLHDVVVAETLSALELSQVQQLEDTLSAHSVNMHLTSVVVDIITKRGDGEAPPYLVRGLKGCCRYLNSIGDFHAVSDIYEIVARKTILPGDGKDVIPNGILEVFSDDDFIGDVLDAPAQWGKEKDFYIVELIKRVGSPFVEPLLDRLASEEDRTLRYFYLDLLGELGTMTREPAIRRLKDNRWFFVRNLIILLRNLNDPSVLPSLHGLLDHPHPRVRHELMQTLIKFNDPIAERIILQEMDSPDTGRCLKAIALAGMTRNRMVSQKLLEFLKQRGLGKTIFPIKKASVHALGEIGDPSVLPALRDILKTRTFFRRHAASNLKLEIIKSLQKYPAGEASPILKGVANSGPQLLADNARTVMKDIGVSSS
jgi:HEAT repeat protein